MVRLGGVEGRAMGASSSCLQSSRKSQQISYRDDGWSGSFHPAQQGSRHGIGIRITPPLTPSTFLTTSSLTLLLHCCSPPPPPPPLSHYPSIHYCFLAAGRSRGESSSACLAVKCLSSISTPGKVSHKHWAAAKNRCNPRRERTSACVTVRVWMQWVTMWSILYIPYISSLDIFKTL